MFASILRGRRAFVAAVLCAGIVGVALTGCSGIHLGGSTTGAAAQAESGDPPPPPLDTPPIPPTPAQQGMRGPAFPSPTPGVTADAASVATARDRLAHVRVPPDAHRSSTRPKGAASALALGFWCQPMADAIGYWTAPGMTVDAVVDFLKTHAPPGLDFVDVTSSNATCATASPGATFVPWGG